MEKECGRYIYLYSVSYLTLTAGDKGIKCPSVSPKQCKTGTIRDTTACHDGYLVSAACHCAPLAAQPPTTLPWRGPHSDTLVDALVRGHRVAACCDKLLDPTR